VKGDGAAEDIVAALTTSTTNMGKRGRGEREKIKKRKVARAIAACEIPVGRVGHEADFTIADLWRRKKRKKGRERQEFRHLQELEYKISQQMRYLLLEFRPLEITAKKKLWKGEEKRKGDGA